MAGIRHQSSEVWQLAARQEDIVRREQLIALGFGRHAIDHRIRRGRLHPLWPGVYAVGSPHVSRRGMLLAAVFACGDGASLSHNSAEELWWRRLAHAGDIHVSIGDSRCRRLAGIRVHRRSALRAEDVTQHGGIPVTTPIATLIDIAPGLTPNALEGTISEGNKLDLFTPDAIRGELDRIAPRPGVAAVRTLLDRHTFLLTDSELERRFVPIARRAGLPPPLTQQRVNGFRVDFYWPDLGLIVETDGLRYHRTPAQQTRDRGRDQAHTAAGLTPLRFTHAQVRYEPHAVEATLRAVARRLGTTDA